jgi:hypothetical protein
MNIYSMINVLACYLQFCLYFSTKFILLFPRVLKCFIAQPFWRLIYLKLHEIRHARYSGGLTAQTSCQFGIPIRDLMCYLTFFGPHSADFLTSRSWFFILFLLPSSLSIFAFFYYTWSCRVMSVASVVDIFGQESRKLLQDRVSVSGIPKWKQTATSWTGCFITAHTKFVRDE